MAMQMAQSQPKDLCDSILLLHSKTDKNIEQKLFDLALKSAQRAMILNNKSNCHNLLAESNLRIARAQIGNGDLENGIRSYLNAISWAERHQQNKLPLVFIEVGNVYANISAYEKAQEYYKKALNSIDLEPLSNMQVFAIEGLAYSQYQMGELDKAIVSYSQLDTLSVFVNQIQTRIRALHYLSVIYNMKNDFEHVNRTYIKLYELSESRADTLGMILALNNMAFAQIRNRKNNDATQSLEKALELATGFEISNHLLAGLYLNLGINYQNLQNIPKAIQYLNTSLDIHKRSKDDLNCAKICNILANIFLVKGDHHNASQHALKAIDYAKSYGNMQLLSTCYETYSKILKQGNDHTKALSYYEKYLALRDSLLLIERLETQKRGDVFNKLVKAEKEQQLFIADEEVKDLMLKQLRLEMETKRQEVELLKRQSELESLEKEKQFHSLLISKKENETRLQKALIQNLEQENSLNALKIIQKETEEKERLREIELLQSETKRKELELERETEKRKRIIWMLALSFLALLSMIIGMIAIFKRNRMLAEQKKVIESKNQSLEKANIEITDKNVQLSEMAEEVRAQNDEITFQKELIEDKNKSITDSIQYASIIQNAVISDEKILFSLFKDHFVLLKPRDIVSGDFWWCTQKKHRIILAVADCTGHGVPGAILSILGISLLNEIVTHNPLIKANDLLQSLRKMVIESLSNTAGNDTPRDGMDISVCIFDTEKQVVEIALANHKICIVHNEQFEVVKGDNAPIGVGVGFNKPFTIQIKPIVAETKYYLFSDGFADQFGGEKGKKMNHKMFRDLLYSSSKNSMQQQQQILEQEFMNWKGNYDQIDDVTIVGVKI